MKRLPLGFFLAATSVSAFATPILQNTSFETNNVSSGSFLYANNAVGIPANETGVTATGWNFVSGTNSGISNGSAGWGTAQSGTSLAFLQQFSQISQTFSSSGNYSINLSFYMMDRPGYSLAQVVNVMLNNQIIDTITPGNSSTWTQYSINNLLIGAGNYTLTFEGTVTSVDTSALLDNISMTATASNVAEPASLTLLGFGLAGLCFTRRKS